MLKVIFENSEASSRSGTSRDGRPYTIRSQEARLVGELIAGPITVSLTDTQPPYPPGEYLLDLDKSVRIGQYGSLQISPRLALTLQKSSPVHAVRAAQA